VLGLASVLQIRAQEITLNFSNLLQGAQQWARENLDTELTVERLADRANMSPRHFSRSFTAETGISPSKAVERLRVERAVRPGQAAALPGAEVLRLLSRARRLLRNVVRLRRRR